MIFPDLLGEVVEGHPELALVSDPRRQQLLVALRQRVPLPTALAPRPVPLPFAPRVTQSAQFKYKLVTQVRPQFLMLIITCCTK